MTKKLIILAPSAGGKSTLMRYLRTRVEIPVFEMDEEVMKANGGKWPSDNDYKDQVLVPRIVEDIIKKPEIVYLASYVPKGLIEKARQNGFQVVSIHVTLEELQVRNKNRMEEEGYDDATPWQQLQLDNFSELTESGLIDVQIDGHQEPKGIAKEIQVLLS